jgi:tetratricopeptide (TPR) repeat protein
MKAQLFPKNINLSLIWFSTILLFVWIGFSSIACKSDPGNQSKSEMAIVDTAAAKMYADSGIYLLYQAWDWAGAEKALKKALELNPEMGLANAHYGWFQNLKGDNEKALARMRKAVEVEPKNPLWHAWEAWILSLMGDNELAFNATTKSLAIDSSFSVGNYLHGSMLANQGKLKEAIAFLEKASVDPRWYYGLGVAYAKSGNRAKALEIAQQLKVSGEIWNTWGIAEIYAALSEENLALEWLDSAFQKRHPYIPWMGYNQKFRKIMNTPRFTEIIENLNLPR